MSKAKPNVTLTTPMLKAMANPLRRQIFDALGAMGTGRAADLGELLGVAPNKISFHLRELAKAEMIEEAPELARDKRDRVWRPAATTYTTGQPAERTEDKSPSAINAYLGQVIHDEQRRLEATLAHAQQWYAQGNAAIDLAQLSTSNLMLTEDERQELQRRFDAIVPAFREDQKAGKIPTSQPISQRKLWHYSGLLSADELLNGSHPGDQSA
ncbi:helix-turn-helix domain-containing protein [Glutamicibacter sp.]|uniref:winged helix-turn-helix domain-containing protein n=1 Tax=Glutamicibacter sp. TaxID=1931995 RepID=UPI0028BE0341|nr:helix-turn-helix domain-containing protein [Glutamicibacter sp.]